MSQILNKLLDRKLKIDNDIKKVNKNIESNKDKINELYKKIKTIRRAIYNRKKRNKKYNDLTLRIGEIKDEIKHYKNDTIMLKDRILEFESSKNNILLRIENMKVEINNMKDNNTIRCEDCNIDVHRASYSRHLKTKKHLEKKEIEPKKIIDKNNIKETNKNIKRNNKIKYKFTDDILNKIYDITIDRHHKKDLNSQITITSKFDYTGIEMYFIDEIFKEMTHIYAKFINQYKFKYQLSFMLLFYKYEEDGDIRKEAEMAITLNMINNLTQSEIDNANIQWEVEARKQNLEMKESGWHFQRVNSMTISFYNTGNMDGSSYVKVPLRSSAILNIKNDDKYCFLWSILASLHPCENSHPDRVPNYEPYFNELNIEGFDFTNGFRCSDMYRFEKLNNLSINIYELNFDQNKHKLIPIEISKNVSDKVIDLLIYKNHYVLIKKLNVFIGKHDCKYVCRKCLNSYTTHNMLVKHKKLCGENQKLKTSPNSHIYWKKYFQKNKLYFRIYADFEADNKKENTSIGDKTTNIYKQEPVCNGYQIVSELEDVLKSGYYKSPLGQENVNWFVGELIKLENKMNFWFKNTKKDIIMTEEDNQDFENNNICRYCEKYIETNKIRDHCHLTGKYRGPAHNECNLQVKQKDSNFITIGLHNFSNYDCHMFFKTLVDRKKDNVKFEIIPKTDEKYISVRYGCIKFIDTYRFLSSSLDKLVKTLVDNSHKTLKNLKKEVFEDDKILNIINELENMIEKTKRNKSISDLKKKYPDKINELEEAFLDYIGENDLKLLKTEFPDKWRYLTKKLAYPYEYFNSIEDYDKPVDNLENKNFFSKLKNKCPNDSEIDRTREIIKKFNIKDGKELTELYCKSDVLLLTCIFEKFIKVSQNEFGISPLYFVSLPGYTWECGLKYTNIKLQTLQDKEMILLLESGIRGGISGVMGDRYVKSDKNKNIIHFDATNLYGFAMSKPLPYDDIKFETENICLEEILNTPDDSDIGYFLEVDLEYPHNIRQKTKYLPFAPENKSISKDDFGPYMKSIMPKNYVSHKKLICDWTDKRNYLIHYRMLKFYISHGMKIKQVHSVISFNQNKWLEKYIDFNTQKRNQVVNDFEKDFYKLLNNAFYGKTMENVRNRCKIEIIKRDNYDKILRLQRKLTFNGICKSFDNCDSYLEKEHEILMDKPIYLGFAILELSKLHMYETYYNTLQPYFGQENIQLHYMDCDSFILSINSENIIKDLKNLENIFDFSNIDTNHELYSEKNKKVLGKFKIETPKNIFIDEFIALRSKMYAFKCKDKEEDKNKLKGISKSQSKNIKFEEYKICLDGEELENECINYILKSSNHNMYMQGIKKTALSSFDDKRNYIDNITSIPWN